MLTEVGPNGELRNKHVDMGDMRTYRCWVEIYHATNWTNLAEMKWYKIWVAEIEPDMKRCRSRIEFVEFEIAMKRYGNLPRQNRQVRRDEICRLSRDVSAESNPAPEKDLKRLPTK